MTNIRIKLGNWEFIVLFFILLLLAVFMARPVYWTAFWFFFLWVFVSSAWLVYTARGLELKFKVTPEVTVRNEYIDLTLSLFNKSLLPLPVGELYFAGGEGLAEKEYRLYYQNSRVKGKIELDNFVFSREQRKSIQVECFSRGLKKVGPLKIKIFFPMSSIVVEKNFSVIEEFVVQPRLLPFSSEFSPQGVDGKQKKQKRFVTPLEQADTHDLRLFVRGDPPKLINWKVSARQGELYVKRMENVEKAGETELLICLELSEYFYSTALEKDLLLEKALSLIDYFLSSGFKVGILGNGENCYISPARGKKQLFVIRKLFTEINSGSGENLIKYLLSKPRLLNDKKILLIVPGLYESYLHSLKEIKTGSQGFYIILAGELQLQGNNLPEKLNLLQLQCEDNRVSIEQVN